MATIDERLKELEATQGAHEAMIGGILENLTLLREDMSRRFDEAREEMNRRFDATDHGFESIDRRFDLMDAKVSRHFVWLVGVQVMTLAAVVTSLATILAAITAR